MQSGTFLRPGRTHQWLGRASVGPAATVEVTGQSVFLKVPAGGDDLDVEQVAFLPFGLAEQWGPAIPDEQLQQGLARCTPDLKLQVTATGGADPVVGRPADRPRARI